MSGLQITSLNVSHGAIQAIKGVNVSVAPGQIAAVIGSNGAGKTTLLRTISGLIAPDSGTITWQGESLLSSKPEELARRGVIHVPEGKSVIAQLTVKENLQLGGVWRNEKRQTSEAINQVIDIFPRLGERMNQKADTLSGGERQMLALGRALVAKPKLLLLDEPSLGLAPLIVEQIFRTIRELRDAFDLTVVLVEQNAVSALRIADLVVILNLGQGTTVNDPESLIDDPALRKAYLG